MAAFETALSTGTVFVRDGYSPSDGKIDLVFHLHGSPERVKQSFRQSNRAAALVVVSFDGLSGVYSKPFIEDKQLFGRILDEAKTKTAEHFGRESVEIRTLIVTSFSAGFGAVREILPIPEYLTAINKLIMLDSIYAGYVEENRDYVLDSDGKRMVDPANMRAFELIAHRAAQGEASMWITHSQEQPGTYASTSETADYLARTVAARIEPTDGKIDATGLQLITKADLHGFHIRGYAGTGGPAHGAHLDALGVMLGEAGVPELKERRDT